ncbi:MAG TPA: RNA 2',3'-cyclic phosphodiesterase [Thermoleophilia bacterium]|nr:RNA 2',3'-cyclic phosphodiesterase [Thermoleophilia bacterium]HQG54034.1 RNA 2',3'-cyclic phosphodiesterase [Thermoleophilia bacterium]
MSRSWTGETRRLFVACELPPEAGLAVGRWQEAELAPHEELRPASSVHLTLCFLGDVAVERIPEIEEALAAVRFAPLDVDVAGVLFLPPRGPKRVVALELDDHGGALAALQAEVSAALAARRLYRPEKRPFLAHVTVARYRRPGPPFSLQNVNVPRFCLRRMVLYSSVLERAGAVHTPLAVFTAS